MKINFNQYVFKFELGNDYELSYYKRGRIYPITVRFIQTTRKGFNLLNLSTNKCIIRNRHLYAKKWSHKDISIDQKIFTVSVPWYIPFPKIVQKQREA